MKREILAHLTSILSLFALIILFRHYFEFRYILFVVGGLIGTILPDIDHLIYVFGFRPHELTSQRVGYMISKKEWLPALEVLYSTRGERRKMVFHTAFFQLIFLLLAFWLLTSSSSLVGRGLVLAFSLHLLIDQLIDLMELDNLDNWFAEPPLVLHFDKTKATLYWFIQLLAVLLFAFLL